MARVTLSGHGYWVAVDPEYGANLTGMTWRDRPGSEIDILRACADEDLVPGAPSPVGCFPMAPFANRIDGGTFPFAGQVHVVPINRPEENVAIHGLSRFESFRIVLQTDLAVRLLHPYRGDSFAYDLLQEISIDPSGVSLSLTLVNRGRPMPFGIGLHPYFVREAGARLCFGASVRSQAEERHLPVRFIAAQSGPPFSSGAALEGLDGFDAHYSGWKPRRAVLERPEARIAMTMSAEGAFSNLHVYVPPGGSLVCIEPVSHVPNVHNRTTLSRFGKLSVLETGGTLSGRMHLCVTPL